MEATAGARLLDCTDGSPPGGLGSKQVVYLYLSTDSWMAQVLAQQEPEDFIKLFYVQGS